MRGKMYDTRTWSERAYLDSSRKVCISGKRDTISTGGEEMEMEHMPVHTLVF
jgi:hypothetical protein